MSGLPWIPSNEFEEEVVSQQPDRDFIFGCGTQDSSDTFRPRPKAHLQLMAKQCQQRRAFENMLCELPEKGLQRQKLSAIAKVQRISGTKPLGELPTTEDWDSTENLDRETIAMMRHCGIGPSFEEPLIEKQTSGTSSYNEKLHVVNNGVGSLPVFFDECYFKLKPRCPILEPLRVQSNNREKTDSACVPQFTKTFTNIPTSSTYASSNLSSDWVRAVEKQEHEIPYKLLKNSSAKSSSIDCSLSSNDIDQSINI